MYLLNKQQFIYIIIIYIYLYKYFFVTTYQPYKLMTSIVEALKPNKKKKKMEVYCVAKTGSELFQSRTTFSPILELPSRTSHKY